MLARGGKIIVSFGVIYPCVLCVNKNEYVYVLLCINSHYNIGVQYFNPIKITSNIANCENKNVNVYRL